MPLPERPPLDPYTCEKIDSELHEIDASHWPKITAMRVKNYHAPDEPVPPQQPQHLLHEIEWYAERLFKVEADYYEPSQYEIHYGGWLSCLAARITARVMKNLHTLEDGVPGTMIVGYHGLAMPRIEEILVMKLNEQRQQYEKEVYERQRGTVLVSSATTDAYAKAGIDVSSASPLLRMAMTVPVAQETSAETSAEDKLKAGRRVLLDSYREHFPDVKLADIQWAAKQTRREWTRWIGGKGKDGSKPDRTFRHILTSGKSPEQIMGKPRPTKYNA